MRKSMVYTLSLLLFGSMFPTASPAQLGGMFNKNKKPDTPSTTAPVYSDADKAMLAKIEQMPDIQEKIQTEWTERRQKDLDLAAYINQTVDWGKTQNRIEDHATQTQRLYDNPMVQVYVNNIGQQLVPKDSPNLYAFRVLYDPIPKAYSLSTGTIYVTTGLLSMLDNEAQLGYILGHEIAHVEQRHEYKRVHDAIVNEEFVKEKNAKAEMKKELLGAAMSIGGGMLGAKLGGIGGAGIGVLSGLGISELLYHPKELSLTDWSTVEEDEADEMGARFMLNRGYDVREVPRMYASLDRLVSKDERIGLGFMGNPKRVHERMGHLKQFIEGPFHDDIDKRMKAGGMIGNGPNFPILLAAAKRDNAILALEFDLFDEARQNLEDAIVQRSTDPLVHFYLAKVEGLTARTPEEHQQAIVHIKNALRLDDARGAIPDLHLEYAITLLEQNNPSDREEILKELKTYVILYDRDHGGLPGNMPAIFDYFALVGDNSWYLPGGWYRETQMMNTTGATTISPDQVIHRALSLASELPVADEHPAISAPRPKTPANQHR
jgi:predicted Zn-dependent protease